MSLVRITLPEELYMGLVASLEVPSIMHVFFVSPEFIWGNYLSLFGVIYPLFGVIYPSLFGVIYLSLFGVSYLSLVGSFSLWSTQVLLPMVIL